MTNAKQPAFMGDETVKERKARKKKAARLLGDCGYTPIAAISLANHLMFLKHRPQHHQDQIIAAITKIVKGK